MIRSFIAAVLVAGGTIFGFAGAASAQNQQEGLINVAITDVTVQVPVAVAANICGVDVNVLVQDLQSGPVLCDSGATATAVAPQGNGSGPNNQSGLVNIYAADLVVQVPIGVAANVCGVKVNVLVDQLQDGITECDAVANSGAG